MLKPKSSSPSPSSNSISAGNQATGGSLKTGEKPKGAKPVKRLSLQTSKDKDKPVWEDVASFWEQKSKSGNTYLSGKAKDGTRYYLFTEKDGGTSLSTKDEEGKFSKIADLKPNKKGSLGAEIESGYLLLRDADAGSKSASK